MDQLANRSLAKGINAWTDVDHTAFTLTTGGPQGFLSMLPVFLDHILFPMLTDAAFLTEVHHVTAEGVDGGNPCAIHPCWALGSIASDETQWLPFCIHNQVLSIPRW